MTELGIYHFITLSAILFCIAIAGMFSNRKNLIALLMSIELMLLAVNISLVAFSAFLNDLTGQIITIFVLTVAGAEAAIGLAIIVIYSNNRKTIEIEDASALSG